MKRLLILATLILAALLFGSALFAIDEAEETEFAYGTVTFMDIASGAIIIKEQDYETGIESDVNYYLSPETDCENISSINEIALGNDVDVSFVVKENGKKVIKFISVYKPELESEEE